MASKKQIAAFEVWAAAENEMEKLSAQYFATGCPEQLRGDYRATHAREVEARRLMLIAVHNGL